MLFTSFRVNIQYNLDIRELSGPEKIALISRFLLYQDLLYPGYTVYNAIKCSYNNLCFVLVKWNTCGTARVKIELTTMNILLVITLKCDSLQKVNWQKWIWILRVSQEADLHMAPTVSVTNGFCLSSSENDMHFLIL